MSPANVPTETTYKRPDRKPDATLRGSHNCSLYFRESLLAWDKGDSAVRLFRVTDGEVRILIDNDWYPVIRGRAFNAFVVREYNKYLVRLILE